VLRVKRPAARAVPVGERPVVREVLLADKAETVRAAAE